MRVRRIAAVALTLAATVLSTTAQQGSPASAAPGTPAPAKAAASTTALTLDVSGCGSCSVQLWHAIDGGGTVWHSKPKKIGSDGVVHFDVANRRTHGLSFTLDAPWAGNIGAVPNLVTRYHGFDTGSAVGHTDARNADQAEGCWAGTDKSAKTLSFRVDRIKARTVDGQPTEIPLAWAPTTLHSWKPMLKTYKGTIGNQDALYCTKPVAKTEVVFKTGSCDGCEMNVYSAFSDRPHHTWQGRAHDIKDGSISFLVPRTRLAGLSASISSPKEGATGYLTQVAFRYGRTSPGDTVSFATARTKHRASGCYAGSSASKVVFDLGARLVSVEGNTGPTKGLIAWTKTTQPYLQPMNRTGGGILGSQELMYCGS